MDSADKGNEDGRAAEAPREPRACPICGTKFVATADREFCPVCILHGAFGAESGATGESGSVAELAAAITEEADGGSQLRRFEHYEVILDEAGKPMELGRGAMGITYKALYWARRPAGLSDRRSRLQRCLHPFTSKVMP